MDPEKEFSAAIAAYNNNDFRTSEALAARLAQMFPNDMNVLKLKGVSQLKQDKFQDGLTSFSRAVLLQPDNLDAWLLLGKTRVKLNDYAGAIDAFSHVIHLHPDSIEAHSLYVLQIMQGVGFNPQSVCQAADHWRQEFFGGASLEQIAEIFEQKQPYDGQIRTVFRNMSNVAFSVGETELAIDLYSKSCVKIEDCADVAKSSDDLKKAYSGIADGYDGLGLHLNIPQTLVGFANRQMPGAANLEVLDGACGTGLIGTLLKPISRRLIGIDLSPDMLDRAKRKGVYDKLICGDLVEEMAALEPPFDLITNCAALYHFGDLSGVFAQASRLLGSGGLFVFSVDPCADDWDMMQTTASEYGHSRRYMRGLAEENGFTEAAIEILPQRAYPGFYCAFRKL